MLFRLFAFALALGAGLFVASFAEAYIQIQLGGVDIAYDGSAVYDNDPFASDPDPLSNATFFQNNVQLGVDTTGVTLDLYMDGVAGIAVSGGTVYSNPGGSLYLDLGGGEFLDLMLASAEVIYLNATVVEFNFIGSVASINNQSLPYGLTLTDPVAVSFSTQLTSSTDDGTYLTSFVSAGTGEISDSSVIPEPASAAIVASGLLSVLRRGRRSRA